MKVVIEYYGTATGAPEVRATVEEENGKVRMKGNKAYVEDLKKGYVNPGDGRKLTPKDGKLFVERLPYHLTGSYVRARVVE